MIKDSPPLLILCQVYLVKEVIQVFQVRTVCQVVLDHKAHQDPQEFLD